MLFFLCGFEVIDVEPFSMSFEMKGKTDFLYIWDILACFHSFRIKHDSMQLLII